MKDERTKRRILIVSDAWYPNVNGVVTATKNLAEQLKAKGHVVLVLSIDKFRSIPEPSDPSVRLAVDVAWRLPAMIDKFRPDCIHISTEGALGYGARAYCLQRGLPFTTAFHSKLPEYIYEHTGFPVDWTYRVLGRFHSAAETVFTATSTLQEHLQKKGIIRTQVVHFLGVDSTKMFRPLLCATKKGSVPGNIARPIHLYVGRVALEKNIRLFLDLEIEGSKVVVGDGPLLLELQAEYPHVCFVGTKLKEELVQHYQMSDVLVFPSETDTFGLVMLEALACGVPVAAMPVPGPLDVIKSPKVGALHHDLSVAVKQASSLSSKDCRSYSRYWSWRRASECFLEAQVFFEFEDDAFRSKSIFRRQLNFLWLLFATWQVPAVLYFLYPICMTIRCFRRLFDNHQGRAPLMET